jgi:hypothetical protein
MCKVCPFLSVAFDVTCIWWSNPSSMY